MIEIMVGTSEPYEWSETIRKYSRHYKPSGFATLQEVIDHHAEQGCPNMGIGYSGGDTVSYHFPATTQRRKIYRAPAPEGMTGCGIMIRSLK